MYRPASSQLATVLAGPRTDAGLGAEMALPGNRH